MNALKERLLRLKGTSPAKANLTGAGDPIQADEGARSTTHYNVCFDRDDTPIEPGWDELGGVRLERNSYGAFMLREHEYAADYCHGRLIVGELGPNIGQLAALTAGGAPELERVLFFDTETTGLGIGAGNVPFLIGVGFYRNGRLVVQQMFIRNPAEEAAMLAYFAELLQRFTHIVSYNGRSFDWPIVKSRFVLARRQLNDIWKQIDLLYPARSLWKSVLPSCRLGSVEERKLGFRRCDDVPGSMAPVLYVQYLAERDPRIIGGVFVHNELDIVSLAALAIHMAQLLQNGCELTGLTDEELLRLASWLDKLKRNQQAERTREELVRRLTGSVLRSGHERMLLQLASDYKKQSRYDRAADLWRLFIAQRGSGFACRIEPYIELSMHYEHRERCFDTALFYAEEALNRVWKRMSLTHVGDQQRVQIEALQHRIGRLRDKLERRRSKSVDADKPYSKSTKLSCRAESARSKRLCAKRDKPEYAIESLV